MSSATFQIEVRDSLEEIPADHWNALNDDGSPFVRHEFLQTLDSTGCLGERTGWYPRYFLVWREGSGPGKDHSRELIAGLAAYVKTNSYGEFVFDWAWAEAYQRNGEDYYPKLVVSIPFTPATGPRFLVKRGEDSAALTQLLRAAAEQFAESQHYSSVHYLFLTKVQDQQLQATDDAPLPRLDCQYHWQNEHYDSFDAFLGECTAKRRKTIRRERRYVSDAGLRLERRAGNTLSDDEWRWVHGFYEATFDRKWGNPSLTEAFFRTVGKLLGEQVLVVFAYDPADPVPMQPVACSVMFVGTHTLYGRYWGCRRDYNSLHFEACYYQGIEFCIERGIAHFEPGAQGEHKITRGFTPTLTHSAHHIFEPAFRDAIARYLDEERPHVEQRCSGLADLLPFKAGSLSL